jgi:hypothetical protein
MRVRTAGASIEKATGVKALFDHAVERHLAWIIGQGHVYADLEKVGKKAGYTVTVVPDPEGEDFWVAVRSDLIHDDIVLEGNAHAAFAFERDALGSVGLGLDGATFNKVGDKDRINSVETAPTVTNDDYTYTEVLYSVTALEKD